DQIEAVARAVEPAGALPSGAHHNVAARTDHGSDALGLHIGPVGDANLALLDRNSVQPFAAMLVGQFKELEAFGGKIKSTVDAPQQRRRIGDLPGAQKGLGPARAALDRFSPAQAIEDQLPVLASERCVIHPMVESQPIPPCKPYVSADGLSPGRQFWMLLFL